MSNATNVHKGKFYPNTDDYYPSHGLSSRSSFLLHANAIRVQPDMTGMDFIDCLDISTPVYGG